jgi:hypothetical protein
MTTHSYTPTAKLNRYTVIVIKQPRKAKKVTRRGKHDTK